MIAIRVENLVKAYGEFRAVDGVSFEVAKGQIFGFLGPNGAGKSTTVGILTTLKMPTSGKATVGGYDVASQADRVRRISGVALQEISLDKIMTPNELLMTQGMLFGMSRKAAIARGEELLRLVKLTEVGRKRVGQFSGGMRRRLDLALALVHQPDILFLDEPTTGLDPASRRDVWEEVRRLNRELGMTIFLTTQYLEEADTLADRIAIIDRGHIAVEGTPNDLKGQFGTEAINLVFGDEATVEQARAQIAGMVDTAQADRKVLRLYMKGAADAVPGIIHRLQSAQLSPQSLTLTQPTLDDVFLKVTGQRFVEDAEAAAPPPAASKGRKKSA
ncbi:MAG: daunorubicin resistance protein DrrA family ABC transporter ATP-binding protein [Chloroflexota bacterium]|nr:MAG: daunorubicin resistance protein DrrA family ABC transporter ATP-binding protein [Chloroflexota bacterium]